MKADRPGRKQLAYLEYMERENGIRRHTNNEDMEQYALLAAGDERCEEIHRKILGSGKTGLLSRDSIRNERYLFVATAALASRACIGAGMSDVRAYQISDMFIRQMDSLTDADAIVDLSCDMMLFYAREMRHLSQRNIASKPVSRCIDHILTHLHEKLSIDDLAALTGLNRSYLTEIFRRETGSSIHDYITQLRIDTAGNMLIYSEYSIADIAATLTFGSQSYFTKVFREHTGLTPKQYRDRHYERRIESAMSK